MDALAALEFAIQVARHRVDKLRTREATSRFVAGTIRQYEDAARALQDLRDQLSPPDTKRP
jgi:hypothetical protein